MTTRKIQEWDLFISYASEDRDAVAHPLFNRLKSLGLSVWMDRTQLTVGDHIRRKIDEGLAKCRFGIVILSPHFFAKDYPQRELDGLASREQDGEKVLLPVWYDVDADDIRRASPMLADRLAARWAEGIDAVTVQLLRVVDPDRLARLHAEDPTTAKGASAAHASRVTSATELAQMLHHVYRFEFQNDDLQPNDVDLVGPFQKELSDWSRIWRDLDPLEHARATVHIGDWFTELSDAGWSVYARVERRQIDVGDPHELPIAVLVFTRSEPPPGSSIDRLLDQGIDKDGLSAKTTNAVELLWHTLGHIKEETSPALYFDALVHPKECDDALRGAVGEGPDNVRAMFEACRDRYPLDRRDPAFVDNPSIDAVRPFVSDRLWSLYGTIRAIHVRLLILACWSYDRQQYIDWRDDEIVNRHLQQMFTHKEVAQIKARRLGAIDDIVVAKLDAEFLAEARRILEGGAIR